MTKIVTVIGARPQIIKSAVVSECIQKQNSISQVLIHTGQHYDSNMSDIFFDELNIGPPDAHLGIGGGMSGQNIGRMIEAIEKELVVHKPDWVLIYGDTDSTLAGALASSKFGVPVAHVEAGLRSFNRKMPEEINRILVDHTSDLLFAPTEKAVKNLLFEGIAEAKIHRTGDVMYDAIRMYKPRAKKPDCIEEGVPFVLSTVHRAENTNDPQTFGSIVRVLNTVAGVKNVILPLHPRTKKSLHRFEVDDLVENVKVIDPVSYLEMLWLLDHCELVITDSGGLQKEAFWHSKPCLVLREETEWIELITEGFNRLLPLEERKPDIILDQIQGMTVPNNRDLYGRGDAAELIVDCILQQ